jgi:two-component system sensor histidine kinase HydH
MSATLAHEIKNPLASLKGNAQLLARMLPAGEKPRAKADRVVDEAMRLEQLTNDLLQFVRTGAIQRAPVAPADVIRDAAGVAARDPAALTLDIDRAPAAWSLDAGRVRQVLINLIDNALAAGPPVRVRAAVEAGQLVLEVADRGPGIAEADRDKIFEPFHTGKTTGTGLGLAIVRRVVELHHGAIRVLDHEGGGAVFRVELPPT